MHIGPDELKPFQITAALDLANMIESYGSERFHFRYDQDTGKVAPFVSRLRAITGAGKTPMLAATAAHLKTGIILWTTSRGAVVYQTYNNLKPLGKYADLLPKGTNVYLISEMSELDWKETLESKNGLTILLATVASFNQDGDVLRIHRKGRDNSPSRWEKLSGLANGEVTRTRRLFVFYDEGHGATQEQFARLTQINPISFVLASASPFPADLTYLLPGRTVQEKEKALSERTISVPTKEVVDAGLLKNRIYFTECRVSQENALQEAQKQYESLHKKFINTGIIPICCFIVNSTERGVDVWEELLKLGVPKQKIAVHLNGAKEEVHRRHGSYLGIADTYTGRKAADRSPLALKTGSYTHIIWNLTLREGWDEPLAYVAYVDGRGRSDIDITQKIGRFLRQPNAKPFEDPDMNSAYFYFNVQDEDFARLIKQTQQELEVEGHEVFHITGEDITRPESRDSLVIRIASVPSIRLQRGKPNNNDRIVLENIPLIEEKDRQAKGKLSTVMLDLKVSSDEARVVREEERDFGTTITVWEIISNQLQRIDTRIVSSTGTIFTASLPNHPKMTQPVQYGSPAINILTNCVSIIKRKLEDEIELVTLGDVSQYEVPNFKLVSPDIKGVSYKIAEKYKVRQFKNAVHGAYNGMNPFEVKVAEALDATGRLWCRNPSSNKGFNIPIPIYGADIGNFMPDFLFWSESCIWAIDPKGKQLLENALATKMLDLDSLGLRIALILEGAYQREGNTWVKSGEAGVTLIRKVVGGIKERQFNSLGLLVASLH